MSSGNAELQNARAHLYGGDFAGSLKVHAAGDKPGLALSGKATGLQLEPLIRALTNQPPNFTGNGSFDLDLAGNGRTVIENVRTAGGKVAFEIGNGTIRGFNVGATLCQAYNLTQGAAAPPGGQPKQTDYQVIKGSAAVASGVAQSNDLLARAPFMDVTGHGSLKLVEQNLDYELEAKLTKPVPIAELPDDAEPRRRLDSAQDQGHGHRSVGHAGLQQALEDRGEEKARRQAAESDLEVAPASALLHHDQEVIADSAQSRPARDAAIEIPKTRVPSRVTVA